MFSDPQSVTVATILKSLPLVNRAGSKSSYSLADGSLTLDVSHVKSKGRNRRLVKLTSYKIATDPLLSGVSRRATGSVHIVLDFPEVDFGTTEQLDLATGLKDWMTSANLTKVIGGES